MIPSPTKEPAKPTPYPATLPKPTSKAVEQKKGPPAPIAKTPATPLPITAEPQAVKLLGPVAKNNMQFLETFFKLATIAKDCQELVENEKELSKKEQIKLSLQRREFRQLFATVKNSRFETF